MVDGSSSIAKKYGISTLVIGLTVVAFGTSMPELLVSLMASARGSAAIALGNVLGSNILNTLLFFGTAALISPLVIKNNTVNREIPFSLLALLALGILVNDSLIDGFDGSILSKSDGVILILFFVIFLYYTFMISKTKESILGRLGSSIKIHSNFTSLSMIIFGILGLFLGGRLIVDGATEIAKFLGLSEAFIGLSIIAIGTSLPELVASAMAVKKGQVDMAIGNIVGTNIFNVLFVLGASSLVRPIVFSPDLNMDMLVLFGITVLLILLIYVGKKNILGKGEGSVLVALYVFYIIFLVYRG